MAVGFAPALGAPAVTTMPALADIYRYLWALLASLIPFFANHITVELPSDIAGDVGRAELALSHPHDGQQVVWNADGQQETLTLDGVTRTYRRYVCPRCGVAGYADVARDVRLE